MPEEGSKKRIAGSSTTCAGGFPPLSKARLPTVRVTFDGQTTTALLDSGCSQTVISRRLIPSGKLGRNGQYSIMMMNGESVKCAGCYDCELTVEGCKLRLNCLVADVLPGYDVILGMDAIKIMGGVWIGGDGSQVSFDRNEVCASAGGSELKIDDQDFYAEFRDGQWHVSWKWVEGTSGPKLRNSVAQYKMDAEVEGSFSSEIEEWINNGWLRPYEGEHNGIIPLMAVTQENKGNVRPVLDFRELNDFVSSHTGSSVVCSEKLRKWRKLGTNLTLIDLKKAYLQVHVDPNLWQYQVVVFKGVKYCLTRLGFGLNVAPKVMTAIVNRVLGLDKSVRAGTDSYIDDIVVNEEVVKAERVVSLLRQYGLEAKPAVSLSGARVLGLRVREKNGRFVWERDNSIAGPTEEMTKRELFSWCGKLVGHFPVASWLRPCCSYLKRLANGSGWDSKVNDRVVSLAQDLWNRLGKGDPVRGVWAAPDVGTGRLWCDASSLAVGVCLELQGAIIEDASWLRREDDATHINLAELESILRGVNLAVSWGLHDVEVMTDSSTVFCWLRNLVTDKERLRTHGMGEALVRRRLCLLSDIMNECELKVRPLLVKSAENKADGLTRVPKDWLREPACCVGSTSRDSVGRDDLIRQVHEKIHCGVEKTLFLTRTSHPQVTVTRDDVRTIVDACLKCKSIDPAPVRWEHGDLEVGKNWTRLACDVTHYQGGLFLTAIDSGPSRFAVWKPLASERLPAVIEALLTVFREFGPPTEILLDNSPTFQSEHLISTCRDWGVKVIYRSAYRASGNGIIERHHRTIKRTAARTGSSVLNAVYWYNYLPLTGQDGWSSPHRCLFRRQWRNPLLPVTSVSSRPWNHNLSQGEEVFVKPPNAKCTTPWNRGIVTAITQEGAIEVDGVNRHIADIRRVLPSIAHPEEDMSSGDESEDSSDADDSVTLRRSTRVTGEPWRYCDEDYECDF